ncbi:hypothetical protein ACFVH6_21750 [Spirillospora sp. NPDC127200]
MTRADWLVCDMDDGVLRREPTRAAARAWWLSHEGAARVIARHRYMPGSYEYIVGQNVEDCASAFIVRSDVAHLGGWDPHQAPLYPHADDPFKRVVR